MSEALERVIAEQQAQIDRLKKEIEQEENLPKWVADALRWAGGLIKKEYPVGHNGADSWLMNYSDLGEQVREHDFRKWEKAGLRWIAHDIRTTPVGYQLVPIEPTEAMCEAYAKTKYEDNEDLEARNVWKEMLGALQIRKLK